MNELLDFSNHRLSSRNLQYGGRAGEKRGIIIDDDFWFLKFPKTTRGMQNVKGISYVTSPLSEYIGSNIFKILGYNAHKTRLGICFDGKRYKVVCACKDFIRDDGDEVLIPYTALRNDTNQLVMERRDSSIDSASSISEIAFQLRHNTILGTIKEAYNWFWEMALVDMLINNNDRNEDNWGVIKYKSKNDYTLAPIYDCGNSFYGKASEEKIAAILNDNERLSSSSLNGTTAYEDDEGNRIGAVSIIKFIKEYDQNAIPRVCENVLQHMKQIEDFINNIPVSFNGVDIISENRKKYYIETIKIRLAYVMNNFR